MQNHLVTLSNQEIQIVNGGVDEEEEQKTTEEPNNTNLPGQLIGVVAVMLILFKFCAPKIQA